MVDLSQKDFNRFEKNLSPVLWLWLPILFCVIQIFIETIVPKDIANAWHEENGVLEIMQTGIIFMALIFSVMCMPHVFKLKDMFLRFWVCIAALGCFYITGEEISWGQHIFGWESNEFWTAINDQQETNFHNTSSWLDQKPRLVIEIGIVTGGLLIPALLKWKPEKLPIAYRIIFPNKNYVLTASIFLLFKLTDRIMSDISGSPFIRGSEVLELFMFYFILIYMIDFHRRINKEPSRRRIIQNP